MYIKEKGHKQYRSATGACVTILLCVEVGGISVIVKPLETLDRILYSFSIWRSEYLLVIQK